MRKHKIAFILIMILFFSGCAGIGDKSSNPNIDTTGYGLEVRFDTKDDLIRKGQISYTLSLENSGSKEVYLSPENTRLLTTQVIQEESEIKNVFTQESLRIFYDKLFPKGELSLVQGESHVASGILEIDRDFMENKNNEKINFYLELNYDYSTDFSNNIKLSHSNEIYTMDVLDSISQAAPLQITKISLNPDLGKDDYILEYYISDKGKSSDISPATKIEDININFRSTYLGSSCKGTYENRRDLELNEITIKKGDNLILECPIHLTGEESFITKTSGDITYNYKMRFDKEVKLPEES